MFQSECMLASKFARAPGCPSQWVDATMKLDLSQNRPARSCLMPDGERCPVTTHLKECEP